MYLLNRCTYWILLDVLHNLRLFFTKCRVFHNAVLFGHKPFTFYIKFAVKFKYLAPRPEGWGRKWKTHGILHPISLYAFTLQSYRYKAYLTVFAITMHIKVFYSRIRTPTLSPIVSLQWSSVRKNRTITAKLFQTEGQKTGNSEAVSQRRTDGHRQNIYHTENNRRLRSFKSTNLEWQNVHFELQGYPFSDFRVQKRQSNRHLVFRISTVQITYKKALFPLKP